MRFRTVRPHEDRPLRAGHQTGSILIAMHVRDGVDIDKTMADVEDLVRALMADWYAHGGHELVEALPDVG